MNSNTKTQTNFEHNEDEIDLSNDKANGGNSGSIGEIAEDIIETIKEGAITNDSLANGRKGR